MASQISVEQLSSIRDRAFGVFTKLESRLADLESCELSCISEAIPLEQLEHLEQWVSTILIRDDIDEQPAVNDAP